jgi:hypothetical protein
MSFGISLTVIKNSKKIKKNFRREKFKLCKVKLMEMTVLNSQFKLTSAIKLNIKIYIQKCIYNLLLSYPVRCYAIYKTLKNLRYRFFFNPYTNPRTNAHYKEMVNILENIVLDPKIYKFNVLQQNQFANLEKKKIFFRISRFFDEAVQEFYSFVISPFIEVKSDKFSYGYRFLRQAVDVSKVILLLCKGKSYTNTFFPFVFNFSLIKNFDSIFNDWLASNLPVIPRFILFQWLELGFIEFNDFCNDFPKGNYKFDIFLKNNSLSFIICNFILNDFQNYFENFVRKQFFNNQSYILIRILNNVIILCSTLKKIKFVKYLLEEFLITRGISISLKVNNIINLFCKKSILTFMGMHFRYFLVHGKYQFKVSVSSFTLVSIKKKVSLLCKNSKTPLRLFKSVNFLVRKWANVYKICNNKFFFIKFSQWLVKKVSKALYFFYINSSFEKGKFAIRKGKRSGRLRRTIAAQVVKRIHFLKPHYRFLYGFNKTINYRKKYSIVLSKRTFKILELFLPKYLRHKKHYISYSKNYFKFFDYYDLRILSFQNKSSFREYFLKLAKGSCPLCLRDLTNSRYKLHCIKPLYLNKKNIFLNFVPLCIYCYKFLNLSIKNNLLNYIRKFIRLGVLKLG